VLSLTLTCSTSGGPGHSYDDLPPMSAELSAFFSGGLAEPDWSDRAAIIDYLVAVYRPFASAARVFDEAGMRALAGRIFDRTKDLAAQLTNPFLIDAGQPWRERLGRIQVPTLVLHGADDPLLPVEHGAALAAEIPGAGLVVLERTGHEVFPPHTWDLVVTTILAHTALGQKAGMTAPL
jgi:pimeloyl-ACP methyl ester carboxylesterase